MDWGSLSGLVIALASVLIGHALEGSTLSSLVQPTAFIVVVFGTFGAVILQTGYKDFFASVRLAINSFSDNKDFKKEDLAVKIKAWSRITKTNSIMQLEDSFHQEKNLFFKKGLRMMVDGLPFSSISEVLKNEIYTFENRQFKLIKIWESAGGYAPTLGILGAVLGLVHVMQNLSEPANLGAGIAVAFVATIYGVGLANLVFLPIANKMKNVAQNEIDAKEMFVDGLSSIYNSEHSFLLEDRLSSYLEQK